MSASDNGFQMVIKIKLTVNNTRLHFEINLLMKFVEEVTFFPKIMLIW